MFNLSPVSGSQETHSYRTPLTLKKDPLGAGGSLPPIHCVKTKITDIINITDETTQQYFQECSLYILLVSEASARGCYSWVYTYSYSPDSPALAVIRYYNL